MNTLLAFWDKLAGVTQLTFREGQGEVIVTKEGSNILIFGEKGAWKDTQGEEINFSNRLRWTLDRKAGVISLEHLRRGEDHPVFLVHLTPSSQHSLSSVSSHFCGKDTYYAKIDMDCYRLCLSWRVTGPKKNEELTYYYT